MKLVAQRDFSNGTVYALETEDGFLVEVTDTFLPYYTKDAIGRHQNALTTSDMGSRAERWMIGVSCMSGCPVRCKFCATGNMKKWRSLTAGEIIEQIEFVLAQNPGARFEDAREHKINYTRMGEPFLNVEAVKAAVAQVDATHPGTHHYVSTIGVLGSDYSWIKDNVTLQVSLHSLDDARRDDLIPVRKMSIEQLGQIRTKSSLKTTLNLTLVDEEDFDVDRLRELFDPNSFFVKLSPINTNCVSEANGLGDGVIEGINTR